MFRGVFETTIDAKGRTSLPARFRETLVDTCGDDRFFITNSLPVKLGDGTVCSGLLVYPHKDWLLFEERLLNDTRYTSLQRDNILRRIVAPALPCTADKLGRVLVPPGLRKNAGLDREIVFVGMLKKIEVWSQSAWERVLAQADSNIPDDSLDLGL